MCAVVAVSAACVFSSASTAAGSRGETGWVPHVARNGLVELSTPKAWVDLTKHSVKRDGPGFTLAVYDLTRDGRVLGDVKVYEKLDPPSISLEQVAAATVEQLQASGLLVGSVSEKLVSVPAGRAAKLTMHLLFPDRHRSMVVTYLFVRRGVVVGVNYASVESSAQVLAPIFSRSIQTFRYR